MNSKRTATIVVVGGVFAAWLANAMTPVGRAPVASAVETARPVDARGADLAKEIARLHDRLRPEAAPSALGRNLFEFKRARAAAVVAAPQVATALPPVAAVMPQAPLTLAGIAEDPAANGIVRTAIISGSGQLFLVKEGDEVAPRYKVTKIAADGVDLQDADGTFRHLALK
jgi:hypothetical protein